MNGAGLYNHIFDFKYVLPFASNYSRRVFVEPLRSPHYDTDLILCDYLAMPGLYCLRKRSLMSSSCSGHFQNAIKSIQQNKTRVCFAEAAFNRKTHPYAMGRLTAMDEFVLESLFMMHAAVLINYGISTIHDAIESERYLMAQEEQRLHPTRPGSISVCYMVQDRYSWCHGLEVERNYRQFGLPFTFEDKRGVVKRFDQFNLPPAYPNSALVLPEAG
eukprot:gene2712-1969_t